MKNYFGPYLLLFFFISGLSQYQYKILDSNACHYLLKVLHLECHYLLGVQQITHKFTPLELPLFVSYLAINNFMVITFPVYRYFQMCEQLIVFYILH